MTISSRPVLPRWQSKTLLESRHGIIQSVVIRLVEAMNTKQRLLAAIRAIKICSNN